MSPATNRNCVDASNFLKIDASLEPTGMRDIPMPEEEPLLNTTLNPTGINTSVMIDSQPLSQMDFFEADPYMMLLDDNPFQSMPQAQEDFFEDLAAVCTSTAEPRAESIARADTQHY